MDSLGSKEQPGQQKQLVAGQAEGSNQATTADEQVVAQKDASDGAVVQAAEAAREAAAPKRDAAGKIIS